MAKRLSHNYLILVHQTENPSTNKLQSLRYYRHHRKTINKALMIILSLMKAHLASHACPHNLQENGAKRQQIRVKRSERLQFG